MDQGEVRVGFVGVGAMGQCAHLRNYVTVPDCQVVAIAELRQQTGRAVARRYGVANVYRSHEEMLAAGGLDAIVASQPFTRHGVLLKELTKADLPIFIEKPLAGCIEVGQAILEALARTRSRIMVGYHKRCDPATQFAKAEIDRLQETGELGALKYVRILMPAGDWIAGGFTDLIDCGEPKPDLAWDPPASDMDAETNRTYVSFVNYYIHQVNLMRHLLGEGYRVTYADPSGVVLAGQGDSGAACVIEMSPYRTSVDWQESALVAFEKGYVKLELPAPLASCRPGRVEVLRDPGGATAPQVLQPHLPWVHAMRQQAVNFVRFARGEAPAPCEAAEALEDLNVAREYIRLWKGK
jgi:predicted dehydrogenase